MESIDHDFLSNNIPISPLDSLSFDDDEPSQERQKINGNAFKDWEGFCDDDGLEEFGLVPDNMAALQNKNHQRKDSNPDFAPEPSAALSDELLESMSIQNLNKYLRGLGKYQRQPIRKRRRILKNRKYALKCRQKSAERSGDVAVENSVLEEELFRAKGELQKIAEERDQYKTKYKQLRDTFTAIQGAAMAGEKLLE